MMPNKNREGVEVKFLFIILVVVTFLNVAQAFHDSGDTTDLVKKRIDCRDAGGDPVTKLNIFGKPDGVKCIYPELQ